MTFTLCRQVNSARHPVATQEWEAVRTGRLCYQSDDSSMCSRHEDACLDSGLCLQLQNDLLSPAEPLMMADCLLLCIVGGFALYR